MKKFVKLFYIALCLLLCASVLFSADPAFYGHEHNCPGEYCQYCQAVSVKQELMRLVLSGFFSASFALIFLQLLNNLSSIGNKISNEKSLVTCKVKLTA